MNQGLYSGVSAMAGAERRLDVIAHNLANLGTTAFKRQESFTRSLDSATLHGRRRDIAVRALVDFTQGGLRRTGNPTDLALMGAGWFAAEGPRGEVYTRAGNFHVDGKGELLTGDGYPVAWAVRDGAIEPAGESLLIDGEGVVRQGDRVIGRLRLVNFERPDQMRQDARGYWNAPRGLREAAHEAVVHQGTLEQSNAVATDEMIQLIELQRSFESAATLVRSVDESYQRLLQRR